MGGDPWETCQPPASLPGGGVTSAESCPVAARWVSRGLRQHRELQAQEKEPLVKQKLHGFGESDHELGAAKFLPLFSTAGPESP